MSNENATPSLDIRTLGLYEEKRFIPNLNADDYLVRQAGSAVWLCGMYREWIDSTDPHDDPRWHMALAGALTHLIRVHELQGFRDVSGLMTNKLVGRKSYYVEEMRRVMVCDGTASRAGHRIRLAIQAVMYLRGRARYRQLIAAGFGHPYSIWVRDAELNAMTCYDALVLTMGAKWAGRLIRVAVGADTVVMQKIEARK